MAQSIDKELEVCLAQLNDDQKRSLLSVIKSFLLSEEKGYKYTPEELAVFSERRERHLKGQSKPYTVEEAFQPIREIKEEVKQCIDQADEKVVKMIRHAGSRCRK